VPRKPPGKSRKLSKAEPKKGLAVPCESIDPMNLPDDPEPALPAGSKPRPMPAPGVPMPAEEYERLKKKAKHGPAPPADHAQEDQATKK
jgi:hypothetical protein